MMESKAYWNAVLAEDVPTIEMLHSSGVALDGRDGPEQLTPLHLAANVPSATVVTALVALGADIDARDGGGGAPLHQAVLRSKLDSGATAVKLLELGADPWSVSNVGITPLYLALDLERGEPTMIAAFDAAAQALRLSWRRSDSSGLLHAARTGETQQIEEELAAGDVAERDQDGRTALLHVVLRAVPSYARSGRPEINGARTAVRLLTAAGASPLDASDDGSTPLAIATDYDLRELVEELER